MAKPSALKKGVISLLDLIYPDCCLSCGQHLLKGETEICRPCISKLPRTFQEQTPSDNLISLIFSGRCKIHEAYALYYYAKGETVQKILHHIKYKGKKELGVAFGKLLGEQILKHSQLSYDGIVPVPLHPKKMALRGYNQSEIIASGISQALNIPILPQAIQRTVHTSTQTRKGRYERWQNVETIFKANTSELGGKHNLLLIDDVLTTGATLEACVHALTIHENIKVSIATLALTAL